MKKTLILTAAFACAAFTANAQTLVDSWTVDGGAWASARQSATYNESGDPATFQGYLIADDSDARLEITPANPASSFNVLAFGNGDFVYTNSFPNGFSIVVPTVLDGLNEITLQITGALAGVGVNPSFTLLADTLGEGIAYGPADTDNYVTIPAGTISGFAASLYTVTWDVSGLDLSNGFSIDFDLGMHAAFNEISVVQAVPEPSTYALIAGAFGLAAVVVARRRRRA